MLPILIVAFALISIPSFTNEFNFETKYPYVKSGQYNSLFGFSLAGHQMEFDNQGYYNTLVIYF